MSWATRPEALTLQGEPYPLLEVLDDLCPWAGCGRLVVGLPLILYPDQRPGCVAFCLGCASRLGLVDARCGLADGPSDGANATVAKHGRHGPAQQ